MAELGFVPAINPALLHKSKGEFIDGKITQLVRIYYTRLIKASGYSAILFVALHLFFLVAKVFPPSERLNPRPCLIFWYPIEDRFGILSDHSSIIVTLGATLAPFPWHRDGNFHLRDRAALGARNPQALVELLGGLPLSCLVSWHPRTLTLSTRLSGPATV